MAGNLLLGFETSDDAAIYRLSDDNAAILTVDFLTPLVDDPFTFGRIAAANALSDVYAMGGRPLCALNILALDCALGNEVARAILEGGAAAVAEAGALIVGGHTIDDPEPKYGLCVFGSVHPDRVMSNKGARPGDVLYLTKPLGTGLLSAAFKVGRIDEAQFQAAVDSMVELNRLGALAMERAAAHAATDVTGFGLAGHLHEMLEASGVSARLFWDRLPLLPDAWALSCEYCRPGRTFSIIDFAGPFLNQGSLDDEEYDNRLGIICDPQTSGGLLVALAPEDAPVFEEAFAQLVGRPLTPLGTITDEGAGRIFFADAG